MKTIRAMFKQGEWLTPEQLNALQPNPPVQKNQPANDREQRGLRATAWRPGKADHKRGR